MRNLARFVTSVSASVSWAIKLGPDLSGLQGPAELQQVCDSEHAPTLFRQLGRPWKTSPSFSSLPVLSRSLDPCPSCLSVPTRPPQSSSLQQLWNAHTQVLGSEGGGHLRNTSGVSLHGISRKSFLREKWGSRSRPRRWLFQVSVTRTFPELGVGWIVPALRDLPATLLTPTSAGAVG